MQTAGRGRRGHTWVSPFASQFICSMCWKFDSFDKIQGLSLAAGLAQYDVLSELGYRGMMLKWPNDIYAQGGSSPARSSSAPAPRGTAAPS